MKNKFRNITVDDKKYRYYYNPINQNLIIEGDIRHIINMATDERTKEWTPFNNTDSYGVTWLAYGSKNTVISPSSIAMFIKIHNIE